MCEPATIAMASLALSAASTGASLYAQNRTATAQTKNNERQAGAALQAQNANIAAVDTQQGQQAEATAEHIAANNTAGAKAAATARVSAGEAGVSGRSVDSMLRDLAGLNSADNANATTQYLRGDAAVQAQKTNITNRTNSTINSLKTPTSPDYIGAGLRIGSAAVDYNRATTIKK
jgi:hypothetical protein